MTGVESTPTYRLLLEPWCPALAVGPMSSVTFAGALVGPYGLRVVVAVVLALFAAFIYVFNFTSFF